MNMLKKLVLAVVLAVFAGNLSASAESDFYVLKSFNGQIALFFEGEDEPLAVYKTPPEKLFPADAELLSEGIRVRSQTEIASLIADFGLE